MHTPVFLRKFTDTDYEIVREAIKTLSRVDQTAIYCRFWENQTIEEIGEALKIEEKIDVSKLLDEAMNKVKIYCENHPNFSRSKFEVTKLVPLTA